MMQICVIRCNAWISCIKVVCRINKLQVSTRQFAFGGESYILIFVHNMHNYTDGWDLGGGGGDAITNELERSCTVTCFSFIYVIINGKLSFIS